MCPQTGMCAPIVAAGEGSYWDECPPYWCRGTLYWGLCPHNGAEGLHTGMCASILVQGSSVLGWVPTYWSKGAPYWDGCLCTGAGRLQTGMRAPILEQRGSTLGCVPPYWCRGAPYWAQCPHTGAGGPILGRVPHTGWAGLILGQVPPPLMQEGLQTGILPPHTHRACALSPGAQPRVCACAGRERRARALRMRTRTRPYLAQTPPTSAPSSRDVNAHAQCRTRPSAPPTGVAAGPAPLPRSACALRESRAQAGLLLSSQRGGAHSPRPLPRGAGR